MRVHMTAKTDCRPSRVFPIFEILIRSGGNCDRSLKLSEIAPNFARFWLLILLEERQKFWDIDYKILHISNHVAKFRGDRLRELGDLALKRKISSKT